MAQAQQVAPTSSRLEQTGVATSIWAWSSSFWTSLRSVIRPSPAVRLTSSTRGAGSPVTGSTSTYSSSTPTVIISCGYPATP